MQCESLSMFYFISLREGTRRAADKRKSVTKEQRAEYLPVEWRSCLKLDGGELTS